MKRIKINKKEFLRVQKEIEEVLRANDGAPQVAVEVLAKVALKKFKIIK